MASLADRLRSSGALGLLAALVVGLWVVEFVDSYLLGDWLEGGGIHPRRTDGIDGIVWAPVLHGSFSHLVSNTVPLAVLGGLVAIRGRRHWLRVSAIVVIAGGAAVWLVGSSGNHIGASGLVFGYFGALVGAAVFERKLSSIAPAVLALAFYGGIIVGFVPQAGVSWEGHLFGFLAGLAASRSLADRRPRFDWQDPGFPPDEL